MNPVLYKKLCDRVKVLANEIQPLLPPLVQHQERNANAHLRGALKYMYNGAVIKLLPDFEFQNCIDIIEYVAAHPQITLNYQDFIPQSMHRIEQYTVQKEVGLDVIFGSVQ